LRTPIEIDHPREHIPTELSDPGNKTVANGVSDGGGALDAPDKAMTVTAIWRYPVKSMAGERVSWAELTELGIAGDRVVQVYDRRDRIVTARTFPRLLRLHATFGIDGEPLVDGLPWDSHDVRRRVEDAVEPGARLERFDGPQRFDILPLLICADGSVSMFGQDVRRLRPNLVIGGVSGGAEREWPGATLRLPEAHIAIADLRGRCVMTTYDPDSAAQDVDILRDIVRRFGGRLCLNAAVTRAGRVEVGDSVALIAPSTP
jgi:hypothetical protein